MITRRKVRIAIAKRNALADQIQSHCRHLPFDKCFALCSPALREQYVAANRVACFMEEEIIARGGAYRLRHSADDGKTGHLVWRTRATWAPRLVGTK